jgi:hypothetical protein
LQNKKWRIGKEKVEVLTKLQTLSPVAGLSIKAVYVYSIVYDKSSRKGQRPTKTASIQAKI